MSPEQTGAARCLGKPLSPQQPPLLPPQLTEAFSTPSQRFLSRQMYLNHTYAFVPCNLQGRDLPTSRASLPLLCHSVGLVYRSPSLTQKHIRERREGRDGEKGGE